MYILIIVILILGGQDMYFFTVIILITVKMINLNLLSGFNPGERQLCLEMTAVDGQIFILV